MDGALNVVNCVIYDQQESRVNCSDTHPFDWICISGGVAVFTTESENTPNHSQGLVPYPPCLADSSALIIVPQIEMWISLRLVVVKPI